MERSRHHNEYSLGLGTEGRHIQASRTCGKYLFIAYDLQWHTVAVYIVVT